MSSLTTLTNQSRPLSYLSWLQLYKKNAVSQEVALQEYNQYIHDWHTANVDTPTSDIIADMYRALFKEITLNFTTEEEKRFLQNVDLTSKKDLDIIIPFFAKKLKEISQYLVGKREEVKQAKVRYNFSGSTLGLQKNVKQTIFSLIGNKDFVGQFVITTTVPSLSSVVANMAVVVEGLYDTTTSYFDSPAGFNSIDPKSIIDLQRAIIDLLYTFPIILQINPDKQVLLTSDNLELGINVQRSDINDLPYSEFVNAVKSLANLNLSFNQSLYEKYMGTTFYYLSTGSTTLSSVSGVLFSPTNPTSNFLNRYIPAQAAIPNDNNLKTLREVGSFFTPDKLGMLCFASFNESYQIDRTQLSANHVYIFPDPNFFGPGRGNTRSDQSSPVVNREDVSPMRADISNNQLCGDIVDDRYHQKFWPYQSREETLNYQPAGISRFEDSIDFFSGPRKDVWSNSDIYPVSALAVPSFQARINDLLIGDNTLTQWKTDIYGTEFALFKAVDAPRSYTAIAGTYYDTSYTTANSSVSTASVYGRENVGGTLYVRTPFSPRINTVTTTLSSLFVKYQSNQSLITELLSSIQRFDIADNILVIRTPNYLLVEEYSFDFTTGIYTSSSGRKTLLSRLSAASATVVQFLDPFIDTKQIVIGTLTQMTGTTGLSSVTLYPDLYTIDRVSFSFQKVTPSVLSAFTSPVLSARDIQAIDRPCIAYNSSQNTYYFTFFVQTTAQKVQLYNYILNPTLPTWTVDDTLVFITP